MVIRRAEAADASVIAKLHVDSWRSAYRGLVPDERLAKMSYITMTVRFREALFQGSETFFIAEVNSVAAGFLVFGECRDSDLDQKTVIEIRAIYLSPEYWRMGIGSRLYKKGEQFIMSEEYAKITLWVFEKNERARRFYEAVGFTADGAEKILDIGAQLNSIRYSKDIYQDAVPDIA